MYKDRHHVVGSSKGIKSSKNSIFINNNIMMTRPGNYN